MKNKKILFLMYLFNGLMFLFLPVFEILGNKTIFAWFISFSAWAICAIIYILRMLKDE